MTPAKARTLTIRTPEGIFFSLQLAGPLTRFLAFCLDLAVIGTLSGVLKTMINLIGLISTDTAQAVLIIVYFSVAIGYSIGCEWNFQGQTIGKKLLRLRVMDGQGLKLQFSQVVIRNLIRFVDALPLFYLVGGITALLSPRSQRLGDMAANTVVVRSPEISEPDLQQLLPDKFNSFRAYPHLTARLRQHISAPEAGIALQALLRRESLEPMARLRLYNELAVHFKRKVQFPEEAVVGLSDEQYLRNALDLLFRESNRV